MADAGTKIGALVLPRPHLLFMGDVGEVGYAKTALGLRDWAGEHCVAQYVLPGGVDLGLTNMTPAEAARAGARSMVIGIANPGGFIPDSWMDCLDAALDAGLDIISGMHAKLNDMPALADKARKLGRTLIDVRTPPAKIPIATGRKRSGMRLLTVGTDCALGKKYTALSLTRAFSARGVNADFRATGQTGIMIAGGGVPIDAVVSDFVAGAAEMLSPDNDPAHWDVIEGQGSLAHPAYAGVSLGLLHGSQPDVIVLCHDPERRAILGYPNFPMPTLAESMDLALRLGARTNSAIRCAGISLNTSRLSEADANTLLDEVANSVGLPAGDPIRGGARFDALVSSCLQSAQTRTQGDARRAAS